MFWLAVISPVFLALFSNRNIGWTMVIGLCIAVYIVGISDNLFLSKIVAYGYVGNILGYFQSYLIGSYYGYYSEQIEGAEGLKYIVVLFMVTLIIDVAYSGLFLRTIIRVLPIMMLYLLPIKMIPGNLKIFKFSFLIYAIHQPLMYDLKGKVYSLLQPVFHYACIVNVLSKVMILGIYLCIACIIYYVLNRISPSVLKILTGGRTKN